MYEQLTTNWFKNLRDQCCKTFSDIEMLFSGNDHNFERKAWSREGGGGGEISIMRGQVFEKIGVNISTVHGVLAENFRTQIPGTAESPEFYATGISIVAHMHSPLVPAVHFNTRFIKTSKSWFGGGADLTPTYADPQENAIFHAALKDACDQFDPDYYDRFKIQCDEYFYLQHRQEARGAGGIFYDYLNSDSFDNDFNFTQTVGRNFLDIYSKIVIDKMHLPWSAEQKEYQLYKRGRYVEFNLLYDRGTKFGLMTGGNVEAILMSLPPTVKW